MALDSQKIQIHPTAVQTEIKNISLVDAIREGDQTAFACFFNH